MAYSLAVVTFIFSASFACLHAKSILSVNGTTVHGRLDGYAKLRFYMNLEGHHLKQIFCYRLAGGGRSQVYHYMRGEQGTFTGHLKGRAIDAIKGSEFSISINNLIHDDFVSYYCNFQTDSGSSATAVSTLVMTDKVIEVNGVATTVREGETAMLRYLMNMEWYHVERIWCFFSPGNSDGLREVYWYQKSHRVPQEIFSGSLAGRAEALISRGYGLEFIISIQDVKSADAGTYSCNFHAIGSYATATADLTIHNGYIPPLTTGVAVTIGIGVALLVLCALTVILLLACRKDQVQTYIATRWSSRARGDKDKLIQKASPLPKKVAVIDVSDTTNLMRY